jgi:hypothetical protein
VPGWCGCRLWLRTLDTAGAAARAHDADIIAIAGAGGCLNFRDSAYGVAARGLAFIDGKYLIFSPRFKAKMHLLLPFQIISHFKNFGESNHFKG